MLTVLLSRGLGVIRERLLYLYFTPDEAGIYFAAFRLPNFIFELLVVGALSTAFIPVFTNLLIKDSDRGAFTMASQIINISIIAVIILSLPLLIFTRQFSYILVPGFSEGERELLIPFTRIMLLGQLLPLIIGNIITGMLQSYQYFLFPALAPVVYNLGIISGIVLLSPHYGLYGPVTGVVIGGVLFLLIQLPMLLKIKYRHIFKINLHDKNVREVIKLMLPRTFGVAVSQIDTTVDLILASFLGARNISIFYCAQNLQQLPIGLFGATFAQAALPTLSKEATNSDLTGFKKIILASMHQILFFVLPISVMLIVLRTPIVRLAYGSKKFDWAATVITGKTMSIFAISVFAQSLVYLFARAFYALRDTKTPVVIGVASVVTTTILSIIFINILKYPVWSLALSTSIASIINVLFLFIYLYKKVKGFEIKSLIVPPLKMLIASFITGVFLYVPIKLLDQLVFDTTRVFHLLLLTGVATTSGLSVYIFLAWFLDIEEVTAFFKLMQKVKQVPRALFSRSEELVADERAPVA